MRAYEIHDRPGLDALVAVERPEPVPGPKQVLVRMKAASLNYRDLMVAKGTYGRRPPGPIVPLSDGVGEVVALGEGASRVAVGERVAGIFMQAYLAGELTAAKGATALGGAIDGVLAEYVAFDEEGVVRVPEHLSDAEAATLPCAAVTAWDALMDVADLRPGQTVLIQGTGGVSIFALQFAKLAGARAIITSGSDEKLEKAKALGADDLINYKTTPDWDARAFDLTGRVGVDLVVEVGGAGTLDKSIRATRPGGTIALIGVLTGAGGPVNTIGILGKHIRLQGIYVGSRDMFEAMNRAIALAGLRPVVDRVFPFDRARQALEYLEGATHFGKVAIGF